MKDAKVCGRAHYDVDQDEMPNVGRRSKQIAGDIPKIVWSTAMS